LPNSRGQGQRGVPDERLGHTLHFTARRARQSVLVSFPCPINLNAISKETGAAFQGKHVRIAKPFAAARFSGERSLKKLVGVQYLRGFAAIAVLLYHVGDQYKIPFEIGAAGVDIFFVISGFIIWSTTSEISMPDYFWKRLTRVLPLYWIVLAVTFASVTAKPAFFYNHDASIENFFRSLVLLPRLKDGAFHPVVVQGWTLSYEMFFYCLLGVLMAVGLRWRLIGTCATLLVFVAIGQILDLGYSGAFAAPIVLEFVAGVLIAYVAGRLEFSRSAIVVAVLLAVVGFAASQTLTADWPRVLKWGIPAALLVVAAVGLEPWFRQHPVRVLVYFGDASYSIYLWHVWVGTLMTGVLLRLPIPPVLHPEIQAVMMLLMSCLLYNVIEKPLLALFRRPPATVPNGSHGPASTNQLT
jgi:exopolysaccharide production protein ExoZ